MQHLQSQTRSQTQRLLCFSCSSDEEVLTRAEHSKVSGHALGVLFAPGPGTPLTKGPVGHPVGHPGPGEPLTPALCHLLPLGHCCCLFVLGFSPLSTPTPLREKSTFAFWSLANRRGLCSIPVAAPGLQGSHDKSSGVCCQGDPLKHKLGNSVCL